VDSTGGRCQKCKDGFYMDISGKCKNLPPNCVAANMQSGACLECTKDFEIVTPGAACTKKIVIENCQVPDTKNIGKCAVCNNMYFPDGNKCSKVSELCKDYNKQNGKCTSCVSSGFNINDGKCVDPNCATRNGELCTGCVANFELNKAEKICKLVDANCKNLAIAACLECKTGFYIGADKICRPLPLNCQTAGPTGSCLLCNAGFENNNGGCIKTIVIPNCGLVDSVNNRCLNCNDRFYSSGNACASVSPNCNTYNSNNGWCFSCKSSDMVLQPDGTCVVPAPQPTRNPQTNTQGSSQGNTQTTNTQTSSQPTTIRGTVQGSDLNCREYSGTRCTRCSTRYYVNQEINRCVPVNPLCKDSNSAGECTACYQGYKVESGKCIISQSTDANCKANSGGRCNECYQGYYYNQVERICKKVNPLCRGSNPANGACTGCYPGYALNTNNGNCEVSFKDPNCKDFKPDNTCRQCSSRYYVNSNGKCSPANPLCKDFNQNNGLCTTCYPGYGLTDQGQCQAGVSQDNNCKTPQGSSCKECVSGYYTGPEGKCKQASPLCRSFDKNNGNCTACYNGY
jgi:proprotein convertase subtilisin/kexin type 5